MKELIIMAISAVTTIIGGIIWNHAWKKEDYFAGTVGALLLGFSLACILSNFTLQF